MKIESILSIMLISLMISTIMAAVGSAGVADNTPPRVVSFNFGPKLVDVSRGPRNITFTTGLTDDLSGISDGEIDGTTIIPTQARFYSESGDNYLTVEFRSPSSDPKFNNSNLVHGNKLNGIYVSNMAVPRHAEIGNWTLDYFSVIDQAGNKRDYDQYEMFMMGFPIQFYVE